MLSGTVGVEAEAAYHFGIGRVEFLLDGTPAYADYAAPCRWDWNTLGLVDGSTQAVEARAFDAAGNSASDARQVRIDNAIPPLSRTWYLAEGTTA